MEVTPINNTTDYGGYDYRFVEPPDRVVCKICHFPSKNPYLSVCCGHVFCKSCLDNTKRNALTTCPICRSKKFITFPNKQLDREVKGLHVMCTNKEKGCEWQGELNDINNHLGNSDGCQFEDVKCSNECGKMLQRRYLTSHVETECPCRIVDCQYCHITGEHQFIEGEHKKWYKCPKIPLVCPNKCDVEIFGSLADLKAHRKECPLEMIQCEYYNVGCEERMMRKDLEKHCNAMVEVHLSLKLSYTENQLANARKQICALETIIAYQLQRPGTVTSGTTESRWLIKLVEIIYKTGNQVCPVILKILDFSERKQMMACWNSNSFYSHNKGYKICVSIYTAGKGGGEGTHLSVFLCLLKGSHDDELTWPLRGKFQIILLNQTSDCEHHSVTIIYNQHVPAKYVARVDSDDKYIGWGQAKFISHEDLCKVTPTRQYIKDDSVYFQINKL
ncbi:TNF receptor-associated factor 4-like [Dysidea avara]|uniref:TNF receptor-associated factor 4-like n=1 Tax=Dysidea avara TaxID=196820 RepID=UPI003334005C